MALSYETLNAYIDGLYGDGILTTQEYNDIILYILANGEISTSARDLIQVRRGNLADLPVLAQGEIGFTLDEENMYVGGINGNVDIGNKDIINQHTAQLADIAVNVASFGAIGDYYLSNGTVNPSPTDNTVMIQNAFNSSKHVKLAKGAYYCSGNINLPISAIIEGNNCTIMFDNNGINMGDYIWNRPQIYNLEITNIGHKNTGKGLYSNLGYIVYPKLKNVQIYGFDYGLYSESTEGASNFTWGSLEQIRIEYCNIGMYFKGGWFNTVMFKNIWLNYNNYSAIKFDTVQQSHNVTFDGLTIESNGVSTLAEHGTFHIVNCGRGQINIINLYAESNTKGITATPEEKTLYMTTGVKIDGLFYDSKSYLLNGKVYSEDTNRITNEVLVNASVFRVENCGEALVLRINNTFLNTDYAPLVNFSNSNSSVHILNLSLHCAGYSYPNVRSVFVNSTNTFNPKVTTENLYNVGGSSYDYGDLSIKIKGDLFGHYSTETVTKWITDDIKYLNIGRGYAPDFPLYIQFFHELYALTNHKASFNMTKNITVGLGETGMYTTSLNILGEKDIEITDNGINTKTFTINHDISPNQIRWKNTKLTFNCNLTVNDTAIIASNRTLYIFDIRELFVGRIFTMTSLVAPNSQVSIIDRGKLTILGGIVLTGNIGPISTKRVYLDKDEKFGFAMPSSITNSVSTNALPLTKFLGMTVFYTNGINKNYTWNGTNWIDGASNVFV